MRKTREYKRSNFYAKYGKRALDMCFGLLAAIPASVVVVPLYILIKIDDPEHHAFFVQRRPGYKSRIFRMFKLRTMRPVEPGEVAPTYPGAERLTKIGKFLRRTSLDELPQIWNVLVGEMSFIGPRPLLVEYLPMYSAEQMRRHDVLPGISGWAQVNGRNGVSWEKQFAMDVWYVDHVCFALDCKIIRMTIQEVFRQRGVDAWEDRRAAEVDSDGKAYESPFDRY